MPQTLGRYELVKKLAVGGMGEVWVARQKGLVGFEKLVVVKKLLPHLKEDTEFVNMFFDEARIAATLNHPNIAQIYDLGESNGEYYIAMEYVHGQALRDVVNTAWDSEREFPLALTCRVMADTAAALDFAHNAKTAAGAQLDLIHRDVSPQNILLGFNGAVKLIDFGVAKAANKLTRTATGIIKGKYAYMSPEQAYGKPLDGRSDLFGLGIVFWEILCGDRLFKRENDTATLTAVVSDPIAAPSSIDKSLPRGIDALVLKALERDRKDRYQTGAEFRDAIERFLQKQRLPATNAHIAAYLKDLFPDEAEADAFVHVETTQSTDKSGMALPSASVSDLSRVDSKVLDLNELKARIQGTQPTDTMHGFFFNALIAAVLRSVGAAGEPVVRRAAKDPKPYVDALSYPTSEFLRLLWKAVELLVPKCKSVDEAFEQLGRYTMDALLKSAFGRSLEALKGAGPRALFKPLLATLNPMVSPGQRLVVEASEHEVKLVFKGEVLPIQLYTGLFRSLCATLYRSIIEAQWEKTAAERIELTLSWSSKG